MFRAFSGRVAPALPKVRRSLSGLEMTPTLLLWVLVSVLRQDCQALPNPQAGEILAYTLYSQIGSVPLVSHRMEPQSDSLLQMRARVAMVKESVASAGATVRILVAEQGKALRRWPLQRVTARGKCAEKKGEQAVGTADPMGLPKRCSAQN
eukprot:16057-Amphidinium_carterae.1